MRVIASDLMPRRLELARQWGAKWSLQADAPEFPDEVKRLTHGLGLAATVIAVSSERAVTQAQDLLRGSGQHLLFAHTRRGAVTSLDLSKVCVDEKDLTGNCASDVTLQKEVARQVFGRQLEVRLLITHEFPLEQTAAAVEFAAHPRPDSLKVVVVPSASP